MNGLGDFNEVLSLEELNGLQPRPNWQIRNFIMVVDNCALANLGWHGYTFTWSNNHDNSATYGEARLDQAFATKDCMDIFPFTTVTNIDHHESNHFPIKLCLHSDCEPRRVGINVRGKFEAWFT